MASPVTRALALLIAGLWISACASPEERIATHIAKAEAQAAEGHPEQAVVELQQALQLDPNSAEINQRLGELLAKRGAARAASFRFGEAYRLDPTRVDAGLRQAMLLASRAPRRARQLLDAVQAQHPDDAAVYRARSAFALMRGNRNAALADARKAVSTQPDAPESWLQLGLVQRAQLLASQQQRETIDDSRYTEVLASFDHTDVLADGHVGARIEKGHVYASWPGHAQQALDAYRSGVALARDHADAAAGRAAARALEEYARSVGDAALRSEALRALVAADATQVRAWEQLAGLALQREGPEAADRIYGELLERQPERAEAHIAYTNYLVRQQRGEEAIAHLTRVLSDGPDTASLWEQLIRLDLVEGLREEARASLQQMQAHHAEDPLTHMSEVRLAIADGLYAEALAGLDALADQPPNADREQLRALAHAELGQLDEALAAIARVRELSPTLPVAAVHLEASVRHQAGQWQGALDVLRELEAHGVALSPAERVIRARTLFELGQHAEASRVLDSLLADRSGAGIALPEKARRRGARHPEEAKRQLGRALHAAPGSAALLTGLTRIDLQAGRAASALARLDRAIELQLDDPHILMLRAELLLRSGALARAEVDALRALESTPHVLGTGELLFAIYAREGKLAQALRSFEAAESVGVLGPGARAVLGRLYLSQGRTQQAKQIFESELARDPAPASARMGLADLLAGEGQDLERALALARDAVDAMPGQPDALATLGFVEVSTGRAQAGLEHLRSAIELAEARRGDAPASFHYHLGLALAAQERKTEAAEAFERALAIDPEFPGAEAARRAIEATRSHRAPNAS
jgi:tetratricopeptide (TPR) repeat protein